MCVCVCVCVTVCVYVRECEGACVCGACVCEGVWGVHERVCVCV